MYKIVLYYAIFNIYNTTEGEGKDVIFLIYSTLKTIYIFNNIFKNNIGYLAFLEKRQKK